MDLAVGGLLDIVFPASPTYTLASTCSDASENPANYASDYFTCVTSGANVTITGLAAILTSAQLYFDIYASVNAAVTSGTFNLYVY